MHLSAPVPILRSFDEAEARDFYLRYLGFAVDWEHRFEPGLPLYMQVSLGACVLHLSEHHGDSVPGLRVRIGVDDLVSYHARLGERGHPRLRPGLQPQSWGDLELMLTDPFGNRLTFWQAMPGK